MDRVASNRITEGLFGVPRLVLFAAACAAGIISFLAWSHYPGSSSAYWVFVLTSNALLFSGFRTSAVFFDTFIGTFTWLGFWFKLVLTLLLAGGTFGEPVGAFDGSGRAFDRGLWISTCGLLGLLCASFVRGKWIFSYEKRQVSFTQPGFLELYKSHRLLLLGLFAALVTFVTLSNAILGVYQRGLLPRMHLPIGMGALYTWLLLFGLAAISALLLRLDLSLNARFPLIVGIMSLLECFATSISLLSRGMMLIGSALLLGLFSAARKEGIRQPFLRWIVLLTVFVCLFVVSVFAVNHLRTFAYRMSGAEGSDSPFAISSLDVKRLSDSNRALIVGRWVGLEGVLAVSAASDDLGWELWNRAWNERPSKGLSFYDTNLISSPYVNADFSMVRHQSLPGIIAFFYYPGSMSFLFLCCFALGLAAACFEWLVFTVCGHNLILCALLSQVVASRYAHFGYAPTHSYQLFFALILTILIIYGVNRILEVIEKQRLRVNWTS